jgi:hypothetical protein
MFATASHVVSCVFSGVLQVFHTYVASVSTVFERMLQVFHLDIAKVDMMLHMLQLDPPTAPACYSR